MIETLKWQGQRLSPVLQRLRQEAAYALTAVQFLTRIRVPTLNNFKLAWLDQSIVYFPVVGMLVGGLSGVVLVCASAVWPSPIAAMLAIAAGLIVTGALHEDGLADTIDGVVGGHNAEQRLRIMKDSRIGTFGAVAVMMALALKVATLSLFTPFDGATALVAAHTGGRAMSLIAAALTPYVSENPGMKLGLTVRRGRRLAFAIVIGLLPFALVPLMPAAAACLIAAVLCFWFVRATTRALGGHTGDVLGATEQVFEVAVLLVLSGYAV